MTSNCDTALVSVVVPAWNAEETIRATLGSVACQTYRHIEILVVDDGSTDRTVSLAEQFCATEPRARLIRKEHGGVASARNRGIGESRGRWIAPIDADDVWHPEKLERQVEAFHRSAASVGLVYNWFRKIDEGGIVVEPSFTPMVTGCVFRTHLEWNFIGNGSTPLIKAEVLKDLAYETALGAAGNQGCEDYLLQLQIAHRFEFECVPAFLTGYRINRATMSADVDRMIRSHIHMYRILRSKLPAQERLYIERQLARWRAAHALIELRRGRIKAASSEFVAAMGKGPAHALAEAWARLRRSILPRVPQAPDPALGRPFLELSPEDGYPSPPAELSSPAAAEDRTPN